MKDTTQEEESKWTSRVKKLQDEIAEAKKSRNYYEGIRKRKQRELGLMLSLDPRQIQWDIDDEAV